jgi:SNF2 family DNA or RNA helicase
MKTYGTVKYTPGGLVDGREHNGTWTVNCAPHVTEMMKRIFRQVKQNKTGALVFTETPEVSKNLEWALMRWPMNMSEKDSAVLKARSREYDDGQDLVEKILAGGSLSPNGHWPVMEPYNYQVTGSDMILAVKRLILGDDVGLGKTLTTLLTMRDYEALPMLIVCEVHVQLQWQREITKFFPMVNSHIIRKGSVYNITTTRGYYGHAPEVLICSYHKLKGWASHLKGIMRTVVFDEAQQLRRDESDKYTAAQIVAEQALFVVGATASPVYNYGGEVHNIYEVIKPGALGTRSEFKNAWGHEGGNDKIIVNDPRALGSHLRAENLLFARTRKEVGKELPDVVVVPHIVDCNESVLDAELKAHGTLALANMIISGSGTREELFEARGDLDWQMRRATGIAKAPYVAAFTDLLLEEEDKVVLALWHRDVYDIMLDKLKDHKPVMFSGSESVKQKDANFKRFREDPECRLMLMSLRAGAGLDGLQEVCHVVVFGELDWSPKMHDQLIGRLNRDGMDMNDPVVAYYLNCEYGSDPTVLEVLGIKRGQAEPIMNPDVDLLSASNVDVGDRVRRMAEAALKRHRAR